MSHVTSVRETMYLIQSDSLKYIKIIIDVSHQKLKHQRRGVTVLMDIQWPLVPFKNQGWDQAPVRIKCLLLGQQHPPRMPICFSYRVINVITLSYYVKIFGSIPNSRQSPPLLLEIIIWNCVSSRTARLYTVITHNVPGKAICVPILCFDSLYLNNLHLSKYACKVVLYLFCIFPENTHEQQLIPAKILYQCPSQNILDLLMMGSVFNGGHFSTCKTRKKWTPVTFFLHIRHVFLRPGGRFSMTKHDP